MTTYYVLVFTVLTFFFGSVIYALHWSVRTGQFSRFQEGAESIFDDEEPIGRLNDCFPDLEPPELPLRKRA
ncbi:MAG: hypothetical protein AAGD14_04325 [Planctomycetota bacterium]